MFNFINSRHEPCPLRQVMQVGLCLMMVALGFYSAFYSSGAKAKNCTVTDHRSGKTVKKTVDCSTLSNRPPPRSVRPASKAKDTTPPRKSNARPAPRKSNARPAAKDRRKIVVKPIQPEKYLSIVNLINIADTLPARIKVKRNSPRTGPLKSSTIILADDLDLGHRSYSAINRTSPRNLIIVADRITLNGSVKFDLSGTPTRGLDLNDRSGGDLLILANEIICEANGRLEFRSQGGAGMKTVTIKHTVKDHISTKKYQELRVQELRAYGGGMGGNLIIASRRYELGGKNFEDLQTWQGQCLKLSQEGGAGGQLLPEGKGLPDGDSGKVVLYNSQQQAVRDIEQQVLLPVGYSVGVRSIARWGRQGSSKWNLEMLMQLSSRMSVASLENNRIKAVKLLRKATMLASSDIPRLHSDQNVFDKRLADLLEIRKKYDDVLWHEERSIKMLGTLPRQLALFSNGDDLTTQVAPTDVLIRTRKIREQEVLGLIEFDGKGADRLKIEFDFELSLDPLLRSHLLTDLTERGEEFGGIFNDWILIPKPIESTGIIESKVELAAGNQSGRVTLTLNSNSLGLVLARLASITGLQMAFDWRYRNNTNIGGTWPGVNLSLLKRASSPLSVNPDGSITNNSPLDVALEYIEVAENKFIPFAKTHVVLAGKTMTLSDDIKSKGGNISIHPHAVSYVGMDPYKVQSEFQIVNGNEWVDTVSVSNLLGFDEERGGQLNYVEISLHYLTSKEPLAAGPYRLSPVGALGDEVSVSFLHEPLNERRIVVTGTAYYEGGGSQTLQEKTFTDLSIKISQDLLPELRN